MELAPSPLRSPNRDGLGGVIKDDRAMGDTPYVGLTGLGATMTMKYSYYEALPEAFSLERVKQVFEGRGYRWVQRFPAGELQLQEEIWELPEDRGAVRYIFDHFVEVPSIKAESDIHGEPTKILADLVPDLPLIMRNREVSADDNVLAAMQQKARRELKRYEDALNIATTVLGERRQ